MRVQCSICTDLFEDDGAISALPCGHTFHENCINQWLNSANTCPSCRTPVDRGKIIKRLFFDKGDEEGVDENKLTNENNHLKAKLQEKDKEKEAVEEEKKSLQDKIKGTKYMYNVIWPITLTNACKTKMKYLSCSLKVHCLHIHVHSVILFALSYLQNKAVFQNCLNNGYVALQLRIMQM